MPSCEETPLTVATKLALKISVNGDPVTTGAGSVAELLAELGFGAKRVATARNGDFMPAHARAATRLAHGDRIEIVAPRHGG